jgi:ABC-2 type transport system permease protein
VRLPVRLFIENFTLSIKRSLTYRTNLVFGLLMALSMTIASLVTVMAVYAQVDSLAGWTRNEMLVVIGCYQMLGGMLATFIEPNVRWFDERVKKGELDEILLKPVSSLYLATLGSQAPLGLGGVFLGLFVTAIGVRDHFALTNALTGAMALVSAFAVLWATRVLVMLLSLWAPSLSFDVMYDAIWQFGRYPIEIYKQPLRSVFTFIIPIGLATTVPALALTQGMAALTGLSVVAGIGMVLLVKMLWSRSLRRYTSATS